MVRADVNYRFRRLPSAFRYFPRAIFGNRIALLPDGVELPRIQGSAEVVRARPGHLARYRHVCRYEDDGMLPVTYPHVLAGPLHLALLTHRSFIVRLMGLVHISNQIRQLRPLHAAVSHQVRCWVEEHRDGDRGQEFDLHTEFADQDGVAWQEVSTLLARRAPAAGRAIRGARATLRYARPGEGDQVSTVDLRATRSIGRRYGWLSADLNPIHLGDWGARLFGFESAVAHGMWSMARSLAGLGPQLTAAPVAINVEFKLPLYLPSDARLEHWRHDHEWQFVLRDPDAQRPYLAGSAKAI